jgi:hypothetical protein
LPRRRCLRSKQPPQPGQVNREEQGTGKQNLQRYQPAAVLIPGPGRDDARHFELGKAMLCLPDQVRKPDQDREPKSRPEPARPQDFPPSLDQDPGGQAGAQQDDQVLVLQCDPGRESGQEPAALVTTAKSPNDEEEADRPAENVVGGRSVQMSGVEEAGDCDRQGGDGLGAPPAAELARDPGRQQHDRPECKGGQNADPRRRHAEDGGRDGVQQGSQGRLVHVSEIRVPTRHDEIEFVAVESVLAGKEQQEGDGTTRDQ